MANFTGTAGNDTLSGTAGDDTIDISQGGSDTVQGLEGTDVIDAGGAFDESDRINGGGSSYDTLLLRGDYSAGLQVKSTMIEKIAIVKLTGDFVYKLNFDETVQSWGPLQVWADGITGTGRATVDLSAFEYIYAGSTEAANFIDSINNDTYIGCDQTDHIDAYQGGSDILKGNGGEDEFRLMGALDASDRIDGGDGYDTVELNGDYSAGVVLDDDTVIGVEEFYLYGNDGYDIAFGDGTVAAGGSVEIWAAYTSSRVEIDGSAETDGSYYFVDGPGDNIFTGGAGDDFAEIRTGNDKFYGGAGNDSASFSKKITSKDFFDGGDGNDLVAITGHYPDGLTLSATNLVSVETAILEGTGVITARDSLVAAGETMSFSYVFYDIPRYGDNRFNGSAETDGRFVVVGGSDRDVMRGGAMNDTLDGGSGTDTLTGGAGADKLLGGAGNDRLIGGLGRDNLYGGTNDDRFVFTDVAESTAAGPDWIRDWNAGDRIDLSAIDADSNADGLQAFTYIGSAEFSSAGQLRAIVTGSQNTVVTGDIDGDGVADLMIKLGGTQSLSEGSFIL